MPEPAEGTAGAEMQTPDYGALIEEQKAVITAMNEKIKALEGRAASAEEKLAAMNGAKQTAAQHAALTPAQAAKEKLDKAYETLCQELGIYNDKKE